MLLFVILVWHQFSRQIKGKIVCVGRLTHKNEINGVGWRTQRLYNFKKHCFIKFTYINIRWENLNSSLFLLTSSSSPFLPKHEFETELLPVRMRMNSSLSDEVLQERRGLSKHWISLWAWVTTHFRVNNSRVRRRAQRCPFHFEQWLPSLQWRDESMLIGKTWTLQDKGVLFALGVFLKHPSKWLKPHLLIVD